MIQSMTGFASKTFVLQMDKENKTNITMSIKALNSRFFEANCKLPHAISNLETEFVKVMKNKLRRGYVHLVAHIENKSLFKGPVEVALSTVQSYVDGINAIKEKFGIKDEIRLDHIVLQQNIFSVADQPIDDSITRTLIEAIEELCDQVIHARLVEGATLLKDFELRIAAMDKEIDLITSRAKDLIEEHKQKIHAAIKEIGEDENAMADARKSALFTMLDKMDIHEEIVRFKSHLHNLSGYLKNDAVEKGKQLDFTLQELAREINTIAAKCADATISAHAINIKVEVEKTREQAQNIV
jgi:uncharacterized protein (TIGR00255 family)